VEGISVDSRSSSVDDLDLSSEDDDDSIWLAKHIVGYRQLMKETT
jgi:hypothetical protein